MISSGYKGFCYSVLEQAYPRGGSGGRGCRIIFFLLIIHPVLLMHGGWIQDISVKSVIYSLPTSRTSLSIESFTAETDRMYASGIAERHSRRNKNGLSTLVVTLAPHQSSVIHVVCGIRPRRTLGNQPGTDVMCVNIRQPSPRKTPPTSQTQR
jgi:hypothetical protein